jgi:prepilin-type N-terminal cleavage/methylation domain-containing protein
LNRPGVTLLELIVVLAVMSIVGGVAGLGMAARKPMTADDRVQSRIAAARHEALTTGRVVTIVLDTDEGPRAATAYPDGRLLTDAVANIDPMTGRRMREEASHAAH